MENQSGVDGSQGKECVRRVVSWEERCQEVRQVENFLLENAH